jgi:hypothetical protein
MAMNTTQQTITNQQQQQKRTSDAKRSGSSSGPEVSKSKFRVHWNFGSFKYTNEVMAHHDMGARVLITLTYGKIRKCEEFTLYPLFQITDCEELPLDYVLVPGKQQVN